MQEEKGKNKTEYAADTGSDEHTRRVAYRDWKKSRKELRRRKRYRDPGRYLFIGLLLILAAVLFFSYEKHWINGNNWLAALIIGLGLIFIITALHKGLDT